MEDATSAAPVGHDPRVVRQRRRPSRSRRPEAPAPDGGKGGALSGLLVVLPLVAALLVGAYYGVEVATALAAATGALDATGAIAVVATLAGIAVGGVGALAVVLGLSVLVQRAFGRRRAADLPAGPGGGALPTPGNVAADAREAGRTVASVTAPPRTSRERDRQRVVLLAAVIAALAPGVALVLLGAVLVALSWLLPELVLVLLASVLGVLCVALAGPLAFGWITGRDVHEFGGSAAPPGIGRLRRKGRPFPAPPD